MSDGDFVSASDAARELGLSVSAVTRRLQLGHVPARKVGGVWWIDRAQVPVLAALVVPRPRHNGREQ